MVVHVKDKMRETNDEGYSTVVDGTNLAWPSPSENYSWFRMKRAIKYAFLDTIKNKREIEVIDFGCGEGTDLFTLSLLTPKNKKANFTGLDFSKVAVNFANGVAKKRKINNCKFVVGDADSVKFAKKKFDLLMSSEVLEHTDDPLVYLQNANRQLKIGGRIIITTPNQSHILNKCLSLCPNLSKKK